MFLTLKNEKTLKKMRSKTLKNNIFFILGRNLIIRSFEIPHSIWKLHKDFKSVFVFKFRQKTKKFTPKWQKPLFEKRVIGAVVVIHMGQKSTYLKKITPKWQKPLFKNRVQPFTWVAYRWPLLPLGGLLAWYCTHGLAWYAINGLVRYPR